MQPETETKPKKTAKSDKPAAKKAKPAKKAKAPKKSNPAAKKTDDKPAAERTNKKAEVIPMMKRAKGATLAEILAGLELRFEIFVTSAAELNVAR